MCVCHGTPSAQRRSRGKSGHVGRRRLWLQSGLLASFVRNDRCLRSGGALMRTDIAIFGLLLAAEAAIFHGHFAHYISWYPPEFYDQAVYLSAAYELQNAISQNGLWAIWPALRDSAHANGLLLPIEGGTLGALLGGARLPALMVNFVAFGVGQIAAFLAVRHI